MSSVASNVPAAVVVPLKYFEPRWYAVYTFPRHEKAVQEHFSQRSVESYLPLYERVSRWKDRRVRLQMPLFPGYVFARLALNERAHVLSTPGVVRLVGFNGSPAALPDEEIARLQKLLAVRKAEPYPYLGAGRRVRIISGPLAGVEGVVLRRKGGVRIVVSIDSITRSVALDVEAADVQLAA